MILIADSGSTKTTWVLMTAGSASIRIETQGMNPYFTPPEAMETIIRDELLPHLDGKKASAIYFYGAGCSSKTNNETIRSRLSLFFPDASIEIEHDILGAARALFGRDKGIACILGTGSNSCFYDGQTVHTVVPSLGYLFGDEGAGSNMGKKLLEQYLKHRLPEELHQAFDRKYLLSLDEILTALYNRPFPNRFLASFSLFIREHAHHPFMHDIVYTSFVEFIEAHILSYDNYELYPAGFVGSIADSYYDILREALATQSIAMGKVLRNPVEGLVEYHCIAH